MASKYRIDPYNCDSWEDDSRNIDRKYNKATRTTTQRRVKPVKPWQTPAALTARTAKGALA